MRTQLSFFKRNSGGSEQDVFYQNQRLTIINKHVVGDNGEENVDFND